MPWQNQILIVPRLESVNIKLNIKKTGTPGKNLEIS
jgi:hypothetical protein